MYCTKCGENNKDGSTFCVKCGSPLGVSSVKKKRSVTMIAGAVVLVIAGILLMLLIRSRMSGGTDAPGADILAGTECKKCAQIAELQGQLQAKRAENADRTLRDKELARWEYQVQMLTGELETLYDHECTAPRTEVEGRAFVYHLYEGTYTGSWKSTMPDGEGTFVGTYVSYGETFYLSYTGTWKNGAPNGDGMLSRFRSFENDVVSNYYGESYDGEFYNGEMNGSGVCTINYNNGEQYEYYDGKWENGKLVGQANYVEFLNGELYDRGIAEGPNLITVFSERATLEAEAERERLIAGIMITTYVINKYIEHSNAELEKYLADVKASCQADLEQYRTNQQLEELARKQRQEYAAKASYFESKAEDAAYGGYAGDVAYFSDVADYYWGLSK